MSDTRRGTTFPTQVLSGFATACGSPLRNGMKPLDRSQLLRMPRTDLDALFRASTPGTLPHGEGSGTAIVCSGTIFARIIACFVRWFCWQGKIFDASRGELVNRIWPFGFPGIRAKVSRGPSWLDQKEAIILDYSETSLVARKIRDEIREVAPDLYLGKVWWGKTRLIDFIVSFQYQPARPWIRRFWATAGLLLLLLLAYAAVRFTRDEPVTYARPEDHFKYGSTGGERGSGIPYSIWTILPELFPEYLPGRGYASLGFIYESGKDLPVGVSKRNVQGVERVFLNCAICHVGTVRDTPESAPRVIVGMPANTVDLQAFQRFLSACALDEKFTAERIVPEIKRRVAREDALNRLLLRLVGVGLMRDRLLMLRQRFSFMDYEPPFGPGRVDTFNPPKVLLNFRMDNLPERERIGVCDFPSIWLQAPRQGMQLHWDGNNTSVQERNRSAAFGTGATPPTLDRASIKRTEDWLLTNRPPPYPYTINRDLAAKGELLYREYCARCHGKNGTDFSGELVGTVTPIEHIKTDRHRLDSYSPALAANQGLLYAGYGQERFSHFRKTYGYANAPLDGIWLRSPYLHNGSVPTLRELLEPAEKRRKVFYRGYDVIDRSRVGFVADVPEEDGKAYFRFDTQLPGNGNLGHEGREYGTHLGDAEKSAIVEFLKTF